MIQCKKFRRIKFSNPEIPPSLQSPDDDIAHHINEWLIDKPNIIITNIVVSLTDEILIFFKESSELSDLEKELEHTKDLLFEVFNQACQKRYDHESKSIIYGGFGISSYELAQEYLLKTGKIKEEQCE